MIDLINLSKSISKPPRILLHGGQGVGKTTFACHAPAVFVMDIERGIPPSLDIDVPCFVPSSYKSVIECFETLLKQPHDYRTLIIDSVDVLESIITEHTIKENNWSSIAQPSFGRGYATRSQYWTSIWTLLDKLRDERNMCIILIAHSTIIKIEDPILPSFDCHGIHLYKTEAQKVVDWADVVGYALIKTYVTTEGKRTRANTEDERVIYVHNNPSYIAKTRYKMPKEIPLEWNEFAKYLVPTPKKIINNQEIKTE